MMPHLIALIGPAGSGKTTLANQLSLWRNFIKKPFAANLKSMLGIFLRNQDLDSITIDRMLSGDLKEEPTPYFGGQTPRHAMQTLGTEWRNLVDKNLWVDAWEREVRATWASCDINIVVDDMRFLHEAERVAQLGGLVIRIKRDKVTIPSTHQSELEYLEIPYDYILENNSLPETMFRKLLQLRHELNDANDVS